MVKFGKSFRNGQIASWKDQYINYKALKHFIKEQSHAKAKVGQVDDGNQPTQMNKTELVKTFVGMLDKELKKVYMFFVQNERELYIEINSRLHLRRGYYQLDSTGIEKEFDELTKIAIFTTELTKYIHDNIKAVVKILKKFDKKFQHFSPNLANSYVVAKLEMKNSDLLYIFQFKIIDEVCALLEDLKNDLDDVFTRLGGQVNQKQTDINQNLLQNEGGQDGNNQSIVSKSNGITTRIQNIDGYYKELQNQYRAWNRVKKLKEYAASNQGTTSDDIEMNTSTTILSSSGKIISEANKWNVILTLLQKFYCAACSTLIISNNYSTLMYDYGNIEYFSGLILSMTPIGGIISIVFTKYMIIKSYKIPMIISSILALIGNILYTVGIAADSIALHCLSRLMIGFALNSRVHRRYLLDYIPKRKISNYMLSFKLCYLLGNAVGPIITLIFSFMGGKKTNNILQFNPYTNPSWFATFGAAVILILVCVFYVEPVDASFNAYAEGQAPSEAASRSNSFSLEGAFTNKESDKLKEINDKLNQFNEENQYSDTNLVSSSIENIMIRERGPGNTISKAFTIILLNVFFANIISMSFLVNTPMHLHDIIKIKIKVEHKEFDPLLVDKHIAMIIGIGLFSFVAVYFFNFFYVSVKLDQRIYILVLDIIIVVLEIILLLVLTLSKVAESEAVFALLFIFILLFCYLLEDTNIYFFTKIIPSDYSYCGISSSTFIQFLGYFGMFLGSIIALVGLAKDNLTSYFVVLVGIQIGLLIIIAMASIIFMKDFKDKAIRRIFRNKNERKMRRTEF